MFGLADTPKPQKEITVIDSQYEEIYIEDTRVISDAISNYDHDITVIFTYMNSLHKTWFKPGKIGAIYNSETIEFSGTKCDYKKTSLRCANQDGLWVLRSVITEGDEQASINLLLFDDTGVVIGQSNYTVKKKTRIVTKQKKTVTQGASQPISVSSQNCNKATGSCRGNSYTGMQNGSVNATTEDLEPTVIEIRPRITDTSVHQAVAMLYNSIVNY